MGRRVKFILVAALALLSNRQAWAGAPFLTDDPEPVDYQHWEVYLSAAGDRARENDTVIGPAFEVNYGVLPDTQLHLLAPFMHISGDSQPSATGLGDMEFGVKYRFLHETGQRPQIALFPAVELPTGNSGRGLGNGRAWFQLPVWLQKSFGPWTIDAGGGEALNSAPGQRDYPFGGCLIQHSFGPHLTLGGEIFSQGADTDEDRGFTAYNVGASYNFTDNFSLLFSAGRSFAGERRTLWQLAFYWTGGK